MTYRRLILIFLSWFCTSSTFALSCLDKKIPLDEICPMGEFFQKPDNLPRSSAIIPQQPSYFAKPVYNTDLVGVIGEGGNYLLNVKTGQFTPFSGDTDPVPTPDGKLITVPSSSMRFFKYNKEDGSMKIIFNETDNPHDYQSMGILKKNGNKTIYRMLAEIENPEDEEDYHGIYDYEYIEGENESFKRINKKEICPNFKSDDYRLPMISKDGQMVSLFDPTSGTTKILKIKDNFECEVLKDLGFPTGKVEFSPSNKKIAFHVPNSYRKYPGDDGDYTGSNSFIMDLDTDKITPISRNNTGNAYYPSFWNDDETVMYMNQSSVDRPEFKDFKPEDSPYSIRTVKITDPLQINGKVFTESCDGSTFDNNFYSIVALGKLWSQACLKSEFSADENTIKETLPGIQTTATYGDLTSVTSAYFRALSLQPKQCKKLVNACWKELDKDIKGAKDGDPFSWLHHAKGHVEILKWPEDRPKLNKTSEYSFNLFYPVDRIVDFSIPETQEKKKRKEAVFESEESDGKVKVSFDPYEDDGELFKDLAPPPEKGFRFLSKKQLLDACPDEKKKTYGAEKKPYKKKSPKKKAEDVHIDPKKAFDDITKSKCMQCHGNISFDNYENLKHRKTSDGKDFLKEMLHRVRGDQGYKRMPPNGFPSGDSRKKEAMIKYIEELLN